MSAIIGSPAPDFTLKDQNQQDVSLSSFRGKKRVVIVFYPLDWSPVCTKEHACFVNDMKRFDQLDAQVLGLSVDSVWSHKAYRRKDGHPISAARGFSAAWRSGRRSTVFFSKRRASRDERFRSSIKEGKLAWHKNYDIPVVPGRG